MSPSDSYHIDDIQFQLNIVCENTRIIGKAYDCLKLLFMEALFIKEYNSTLNMGLKASKSLHLFYTNFIDLLLCKHLSFIV